jgi:hypothetical protein
VDKHQNEVPYAYPPYGKLGPHSDHLPDGQPVDPAYKMLPPYSDPKKTSTAKPIYLPSFFTDTNKLLTMFKPPPFSPDLYSQSAAPDLPSLFYNDIPRPGDLSRMTRDRCNDFKNIFAEKNFEKSGFFDSKQS